MGNKLIVLTIGIVFFLFASPVFASNEAGASATLARESHQIAQTETEYMIQRMTVQSMLEKYNSPLAGSVDAFMKACRTYELDCYLLPSISGLESTFGKFIYPESHNPFGWGGGLIMYKSWDDCIDAVAKGLRLHYVNHGAISVEQIGPIYSESPTWAARVNIFMKQAKVEEEKNRLLFSRLQVQ